MVRNPSLKLFCLFTNQQMMIFLKTGPNLLKKGVLSSLVSEKLPNMRFSPVFLFFKTCTVQFPVSQQLHFKPQQQVLGFTEMVFAGQGDPFSYHLSTFAALLEKYLLSFVILKIVQGSQKCLNNIHRLISPIERDLSISLFNQLISRKLRCNHTRLELGSCHRVVEKETL